MLFRHIVAMALLVVAGSPAGAADRSPGCGQAPPTPPPSVFTVAGQARQAIVVPPAGYVAGRAYPLVVAFHGRTNSNEQVRDYFGLELAAMPAFLVYPAGLRDAAGRFTWSDPGDPSGKLRDFALFDELLGQLDATYCIDRAAVFVVGHSLGASFANSLACARADRIRGLASVAGGIEARTCAGTVATLLVHNPQDLAVPVTEGLRARKVLLGSVPADDRPLLVEGSFSCEEDRGGVDPLLWCLHHDNLNRRGRFYPHQWPREAGATIMAFFAGLPQRSP